MNAATTLGLFEECKAISQRSEKYVGWVTVMDLVYAYLAHLRGDKKAKALYEACLTCSSGDSEDFLKNRLEAVEHVKPHCWRLAKALHAASKQV